MSRVTSLLREESKKQRGGGWPRSLKLFGKSPWHRKASAGSEASASSSIRDLLRGRTPVTSPVPAIGGLSFSWSLELGQGKGKGGRFANGVV